MSFLGLLLAGIILLLAHISLTDTQAAVSLTVEGGVSLVGPHCPGTVRLFCEGVELVSLRWRYNYTIDIDSFNTNDAPTNVTPSNAAFRNIELVKVNQFSSLTYANFTSILTVDLSQLQQQYITEINCGDTGTNVSVPVSLQPNVPSRPNITALTATYQSSTLIYITVTWLKMGSNCPNFDEFLIYELNLTGLEPTTINQSSCDETVCVETLNIPDQGQEESYTLTLRAIDNAGSSDAYVLPSNIVNQSQQYFSPEVDINDECQAVIQCRRQNSTIACTIQQSTDPNHFDNNNKSTSPLATGLAPNTTYYYKLSLQESNIFFIAEIVRLNATSCIVATQQNLKFLAFLVIVPFLVAVVIIVVLVAALIKRRCYSSSRKGKLDVTTSENYNVYDQVGRRDEIELNNVEETENSNAGSELDTGIDVGPTDENEVNNQTPMEETDTSNPGCELDTENEEREVLQIIKRKHDSKLETIVNEKKEVEKKLEEKKREQEVTEIQIKKAQILSQRLAEKETLLKDEVIIEQDREIKELTIQKETLTKHVEELTDRFEKLQRELKVVKEENRELHNVISLYQNNSDDENQNLVAQIGNQEDQEVAKGSVEYKVKNNLTVIVSSYNVPKSVPASDSSEQQQINNPVSNSSEQQQINSTQTVSPLHSSNESPVNVC